MSSGEKHESKLKYVIPIIAAIIIAIPAYYAIIEPTSPGPIPKPETTLEPIMKNIIDFINPAGKPFTISANEFVTITGRFENYGVIDNQGTLRIQGWNTNTNGLLINHDIIENHGTIQFEHGGFDNYGHVTNYENIITDWKFNNRDSFENLGTIELNKGTHLLNTGSFTNSGIITKECATLITIDGDIEGVDIVDTCTESIP